MKKGQVSQEVMVAIMVLLMIFVLVLVFVFEHNRIGYALNDSYENRRVCSLVANQLNYVFSMKEAVRISFLLDRDVNVGSNYLEIGNYYCYFSGLAVPAALRKGTILIEKNAQGVLIRNE
ncbi:MAG: hypothetical protein HY917_03060 [Candidatus Diapherotrites archaeon]|nr:hypothetical protein [Candidatus Diapherotrites archaeon]